MRCMHSPHSFRHHHGRHRVFHYGLWYLIATQGGYRSKRVRSPRDREPMTWPFVLLFWVGVFLYLWWNMR
jgi:hypothetical protein